MTKRIRYLTTVLVLLLGGSTGLLAQDDTFNPASPAEPAPPGGTVTMLSLVADPADGGTVTGAGWYDAGTKVTLRAYNKTNYAFDRWIDAQGATLSTSSQFQYMKQTGDETLTALFRFDPGNPAEPTEIALQVYYRLTVVATEGGTATGGGRYLPNTRVYLSASANSEYSFTGWYNAAGQRLSTSTGYYYTTTAADEALTARFAPKPFDPSSPDEPSVITPTAPVTPQPTHRVTVTATDGGTVNTGGGTLEEGKTITLTATANTGYVFQGWYSAGTLYQISRSFTYTMGTADIAFEARFTFNPTGPAEPSQPTTGKYALTLMNIVTKPGSTVRFPVYLTSLDSLKDIAFQLTFDPALRPDLTKVELSAKAKGYALSCEAVSDTVYAFTLTGGIIPDGNTPLLAVTVAIPVDIQTAQGYPVKINQVAVAETGGTTLTASTRNGRISVYKNGDANGDNVVDTQDAIMTTQYYLRKKPVDFIIEAANSNDDDNVDTQDVINTTKIYLNKE